jgi:restriction endonuclease S subunit
VPGLGEVPDHWELRQLGRFGRFLKGNGGTKEDETADGVPCIRYGDIYTRHQYFIRQSHSFISVERSSDYTPLQYGDILFAASGETIEEIGKSAVNLIESRACCGGDVIIFRPSIELNAQFMGYAADCRQAAFQKSCMGRGITIMHLYGDQLKYMWVALPPLPEQAAIVRFLTHTDRGIARYIHGKQRLITLLKEQKEVAIHKAVTHGLSPDVRLVPSGVPWLGDIPEHWQVLRNGQLFMQRNRTGSPELPILEVSLRTGVRIREFGRGDRKQIMSDREKYKIAAKGDIAYNMMRMWQGAVGVAPVDGLVSPAYVVARPLDGVSVRYFSNLFRTSAYMGEVDGRSRGIVKDRNRLYWEDFKQISSPVPPTTEQEEIGDFIDETSSRANLAVSQLQEGISLLRQYRIRLIADVVTGKLDVREAAANLPDEPEESLAPDLAEVLEGEDAVDETLEAVEAEAGA